MGWFDAKKKHGGGLFHSDYKSDDYKERQRQKEEDEKKKREEEKRKREEEERERKRKEREEYERDIKQSMDIGNKGKKKISWW